MGSLPLISDHHFEPSAIGVSGPECWAELDPSGDICGQSLEGHLLGAGGVIRVHAPLLRAEEGRSNAECQYPGCKRLALAAIHADRKPEYLPVGAVTRKLDADPPQAMVEAPHTGVAGYGISGGQMFRLDDQGRVAPVKAEDTIPAVEAWDRMAAGVRATIIAKSRGYGNAWQEQGYMGNLARVLSKAARLKNMMWRDPGDEEWGTGTAFDESVVDTLVDLAALCAMTRANIEEGNRWGGERG